MNGDGSGQDQGVVMATPRKKWPHECDWARLDSIAAVRQAGRLLDEFIASTDSPFVPRQLVQIKDELHKIETKLLAVGPKEQE